MSAPSSESAEVVEVPSRGWDARVRVFFSRDEVETFVLTTQRYLIVVDSGTTPAVSAAIVEMVKCDLAGRRLLVVNTHADYDHSWGNATFADDGLYPAPIHRHAPGPRAAAGAGVARPAGAHASTGRDPE